MMETIQNHKREFGIGAIILAVLLIFSFYEYHEKKQAELAASQLELNGNVDLREVSLAFRNSDRITEILVDEGDTVKKGQVLAKLDTQDLNYKIDVTKSQIAAQQAVVDKMHNGTRPEDLAQAAAKVNAAKAEKDFLTADYNRKMDSYNTSGGKAISRQAIDDAKAKLDVASSKLTEAEQANNLAKAGPRAEDVAAAEAQLKGLQDTLAGQEYTLSQSELIAPQDGVIRSRLDTKKWVRVYVAEPDLGKIHEGEAADVYIDSYPDKPVNGTIGYISSTAEFTPKSVQTNELRTALLYEVRVYVDDKDNVLRMGMPATVKIKL